MRPLDERALHDRLRDLFRSLGIEKGRVEVLHDDLAVSVDLEWSWDEEREALARRVLVDRMRDLGYRGRVSLEDEEGRVVVLELGD